MLEFGEKFINYFEKVIIHGVLGTSGVTVAFCNFDKPGRILHLTKSDMNH